MALPRFVLILILAFAALGCGRRGPGWPGSIETVDGVSVVKNPREPILPSGAVGLEEELSVGGAEGDPDYVLGEIRSVDVDADGTMYLLDFLNHQVRVFGADGRFIRSFGRRGQGPGEFNLPGSLHLLPGGRLAVLDFSWMCVFTRSGELLETVSYKGQAISQGALDPSENIIALMIVRDEKNPRYELQALDRDMAFLRAFDSSPLPDIQREGFNPIFPLVRWCLAPDGCVVCGNSGEYALKIFGADGRLLRRIEIDRPPAAPTAADVEERIQDVPPEIKAKLKIPAALPFFRSLAMDDAGRLFVTTFERTPDRSRSLCDVFDAEGRFHTRIAVKALPLRILRDRLYCIEEDEQGYPLLKRYRLIWPREKA